MLHRSLYSGDIVEDTRIPYLMFRKCPDTGRSEKAVLKADPPESSSLPGGSFRLER